MVGVSLTNPNKTDDKEQLVEANSADVFVTVLVSSFDGSISTFFSFDFQPIKGEENDLVIPTVADVRRKQTSVLFGCLSALLMLGCLIIGTWLLFDFVNRTDHVSKRLRYCLSMNIRSRHGVEHAAFELNPWIKIRIIESSSIMVV